MAKPKTVEIVDGNGKSPEVKTTPAKEAPKAFGVKYFISDSKDLKHRDEKGKVVYAFNPFVTLDPKKGEVVKGLLSVKDPALYDILINSPAYGEAFVEVPNPPLVVPAGGKFTTGAVTGRAPRNDQDLVLARELGQLEARWGNGEGGYKDNTPEAVYTRIAELKSALNF